MEAGWDGDPSANGGVGKPEDAGGAKGRLAAANEAAVH